MWVYVYPCMYPTFPTYACYTCIYVSIYVHTLFPNLHTQVNTHTHIVNTSFDHVCNVTLMHLSVTSRVFHTKTIKLIVKLDFFPYSC